MVSRKLDNFYESPKEHYEPKHPRINPIASQKKRNRRCGFYHAVSADIRNNALLAMAESLQDSKDKIQAANRIDLDNGEKNRTRGSPHGNVSCWTTKKIERMVETTLRQVAALPDPIGFYHQYGRNARNGLKIGHRPRTYRSRRRGI